MVTRALWLLLALSLLLTLVTAARADTSIATTAPDFDPKKCSMSDAPYQRDLVRIAELKLPARQGLYMKQAAGRLHALYATSFIESKPRAVAYDLRTRKEVATVDTDQAALVENTAGDLVGILTFRHVDPAPRHLMLWADGKEQWLAQPLVETWGDSATTLVSGDLLVVAFYHRIATGSSLMAFDLKTGAIRWKADVVQMMVGHSKYFNDVSLDLRGTTIVMRGFEAAGCYVQTFDAATGKRLSSSLPNK
jgi:hypothetical protein